MRSRPLSIIQRPAILLIEDNRHFRIRPAALRRRAAGLNISPSCHYFGPRAYPADDTDMIDNRAMNFSTAKPRLFIRH